MLNLIVADLYKLRKSAALKISLAITFLSAAAITATAYFLAEGQISLEASGNAALLMDLVMMSIIGALVAGVFICGDFEHKTIHDAISSGTGRGAVLVSKAIVYFLAVAVLVLPYPLITAVAAGTGYAFAAPFAPSVFLQILADRSGVALTAPALGKMLAIALTMIAVHAARLSICVLLAFVMRKPALVTGIGVAATILGDLAVGFHEKIPVLGAVFLYTPFAMNHTVVSMNAGAGDLLKAITVSLVFIAAVLAMTYGAFRRAEIK
ncbi:MAG: hypothetical protein K0R57_2462 [Paenibacillaceae bacterium]|jgi:ABC-2 type transport system permease protein|nr:hypothetical protein [Paenibacillaceae bacterium]